MTDPTTRALIHLESSPDGLTAYPVAMLPNTPEWNLVGREVIVTMLPAPQATGDEIEHPKGRLELAEAALYDFLDALVLAKQNDDVMSVVDAMLATYTQVAKHLHERQPGPCSLCGAPTTRPDQMDVCDECYGADHARRSTTGDEWPT
jgi:hypothetical protein